MLSDIWYILRKDLTVDFRRLENFLSMLFFSLIILLVFAFALDSDESTRRLVAPGVFWVTFLLSGILSLSKSFQMEKENDCMQTLLLSPADRGTIYIGKMLSNLVFILIVQILVIPIFSLLFYSLPLNQLAELACLSFLSAFGFAALGTLLAGLTTDLRFKEILLPILLFPLLIPLLLASVLITHSIFSAQGLTAEGNWLKLLIAYDLIFFILSWLIFDFAMER